MAEECRWKEDTQEWKLVLLDWLSEYWLYSLHPGAVSPFVSYCISYVAYLSPANSVGPGTQ
jgi:hypothetical protein